MDRVVCPVLVGREREVTELEDALLAIEYLINPEAILIGGRLPAGLDPRRRPPERGRRTPASDDSADPAC